MPLPSVPRRSFLSSLAAAIPFIGSLVSPSREASADLVLTLPPKETGWDFDPSSYWSVERSNLVDDQGVTGRVTKIIRSWISDEFDCLTQCDPRWPVPQGYSRSAHLRIIRQLPLGDTGQYIHEQELTMIDKRLDTRASIITWNPQANRWELPGDPPGPAPTP